MNKVLFRATIFVLPLVIILLILEIRLRTIVNTYGWKKEMIEYHADDTKILLLGNSMVFCGIIPSQLRLPSYNLANNSQDLYYDSQLIMKYIGKCKNLKYIFVSINYASFEYFLDQGEESWRSSFYKTAYAIPPRVKMYTLKDYSRIQLYGFQTGIKLSFNKDKTALFENIDSLGWMKGNANVIDSSSTSVKNGEKLYTHDLKSLSCGNIPENVSLLLQIVKTSQERGIKVIFITPPLSGLYTRQLSSSAVYLRNQSIVQDLCMKNNIRYYNYMFDQRFDARDFSDFKHLNPDGALKFSQLINNEILKN